MSSMPFFNYAKREGLSYGDVLCFADAYNKRFTGLNESEKAAKRKFMNTCKGQAIIELCKAENERRARAIELSPRLTFTVEGNERYNIDVASPGYNYCSEQANACEQDEGA